MCLELYFPECKKHLALSHVKMFSPEELGNINHFESRSTIYSYFDFDLKDSSLRLPYQRHSSSADCARELFKSSNRSASLVDCTRKKYFGCG